MNTKTTLPHVSLHLAFSRPLLGKGIVAQNLVDQARAVHGRVRVHSADHNLQLRSDSCRLAPADSSRQTVQEKAKATQGAQAGDEKGRELKGGAIFV